MPDVLRNPGRQIRINLDTAEVGYEFAVDAHIIRFTSASDADQAIRVKINDSTAEWETWQVGMGYAHMAIERIWIAYDANEGKKATVQLAGAASMADPSKFEVFPVTSSSTVQITNTDDKPVPIEAVSTLPVEAAQIDMSEQPAAFWLDGTKDTTSVDGDLVIELATGRTLDIKSAVVSGDTGVIEVRDENDAKRWIEMGGTAGNKIEKWILASGHKLFLRSTDAANTAKFSYAGILTITGGATPYDEITIDSSEVGAGGHTSHLVWFPKSIMSNQARAIIRPDGGDVRVKSADGATEYPRATVKQWGVAIGWLALIPNVSDSSDTTVRLEYDGTRSEPAAGDTYGRHAAMVDYDLFLPMLDDPAGGTMYDLSPNDLHATVSGTLATSADGLVFGGAGHLVVPNTGGILDAGAGDLSIGLELKTTLLSNDYNNLVTNTKDGTDLECAAVMYGDTEAVWWGVTNAAGASAHQYRTDALSNGTLRRLLNTYDSTSGAAWAYVDGATGGTSHDQDSVGVDWETGNAIRIGGGIVGTSTPMLNMVGTLRHVTWRRSVVSAAQRATEQANWSDPATFFKTITAK